MNYTAMLLLAVVCLLFPTTTIKTITDAPFRAFYVVQHTQKDLICLAKNIYFEARGEELTGKVAVAQVTLNRVLHASNFEKTICKVVYSKDQFSWTNNSKHVINDLARWEDSLKVAQGVLAGKLFIENFDALYFHAQYVKPQWQKTKQYLIKIGNHVFYTE
jgi:spore germination cell wall hydrolase CwlJ-like protein